MRGRTRLAITGPPAAGKSTLLGLLAREGVPTFSADEVVRRLSRPCQPGYHGVLRHLGERFLAPDGTLDRRALLEAMLRDPGVKRALEEVFHPLVRAELVSWLAKRDHHLLAAEVPLLYQAGWEGLFDRVVFVTAREETLVARLRQRLGDEHLARALLGTYRASPRPGDLVVPEGFGPEVTRRLLDAVQR